MTLELNGALMDEPLKVRGSVKVTLSAAGCHSGMTLWQMPSSSSFYSLSLCFTFSFTISLFVKDSRTCKHQSPASLSPFSSNSSPFLPPLLISQSVTHTFLSFVLLFSYPPSL